MASTPQLPLPPTPAELEQLLLLIGDAKTTSYFAGMWAAAIIVSLTSTTTSRSTDISHVCRQPGSLTLRLMFTHDSDMTTSFRLIKRCHFPLLCISFSHFATEDRIHMEKMHQLVLCELHIRMWLMNCIQLPLLMHPLDLGKSIRFSPGLQQ